MKILVWMPAASRVPGGHNVQLQKTVDHLQKLGIESEYSVEPNPDVSKYDLVHGYALLPHQMRGCISLGVPVVLSTIHWSLSYRYPAADPGLISALSLALARSRTGLSLLWKTMQGECEPKCLAMVERHLHKLAAFEMASLLLPNSQMEAQQVLADFRVTTPMRVVPNAVDHLVFYDRNVNGARDSVLYCGRFEPHKNQLGLIRAMRGTKLKLVLVGPAHPDHQSYYHLCRREAGANVRFIDNVPHEELPAIYSQARVHVVPSWFETTGLVSLEAALCGCTIVSTERGYAREYFGEYAYYCDPARPDSIRSVVLKAFESKANPSLVERILNNYTWEHTAKATGAAYKEVLEVRSAVAL